MFRVGIGYDAHRLVEGRKLILGGVEIPFEKGLEGHSDADVLSHAVADSILGAAGLGDIGMHFPDTEDKYKDIISLKLLEYVRDLVYYEGWEIGNIDSVLILEGPRISPFADRMRENIAKALWMDTADLSIKATTTEGMGFEGKGEGISAQAVCLLRVKTAK